MTDFFEDSAYFGISLSMLTYGAGWLVNKKSGKPIFNPLLISVAVTIAVLALGHIDYDV